MKGIGRNLRYWCRIAEQTFLIVAIVLALLMIIFGIIQGKGAELWLVPVYIMTTGGIIVIVFGLNIGAYYLSYALAMGSTRKAAVAGAEAALHLLAFQVTACVYLFSRLCSGSRPFLSDAVLTGVMLCLCAMGNLITAVCLKAGPKAGIAVYVVFGTAACTAQAVLLMVAENHSFAEGHYLRSSWAGIPAAAAAIDLLSILIFYAAIRKAEVRV